MRGSGPVKNGRLRSIMNQAQATPPLFLPLGTEEDTGRLAEALARAVSVNTDLICQKGLNIRLEGNLGAGKTTFTRMLLRALGITGRVKSPTFELVSTYPVAGGITFYHFDFYRFEEPVEFEDAGFREDFGPGCLCATEWSEKAAGFLPPADLTLFLSYTPSGRNAKLTAQSAAGEKLLSEVSSWI